MSSTSRSTGRSAIVRTVSTIMWGYMRIINVLSFGAGVQSSALAIMAERGEIESKIDFAVFADTQAEPKEVYDWLNYMETKVSFPIIRVSKGNIIEDALSGSRFAAMPFFAKKLDGTIGMARRQCTAEYKIYPVRKAIRERLGYEKGERVKNHHVFLHMGISIDESRRMSISDVPWAEHEYPLVDNRITRSDCVSYLEKLGYGTPPKSACYVCPFRDNRSWRNMRDNDHQSWVAAIEFDKNMRKKSRFDCDIFLHRDCLPLDQVDLDSELNQLDMFRNECTGGCGV